jgi:tetratricopeptide (TPR) repeat protein
MGLAIAIIAALAAACGLVVAQRWSGRKPAAKALQTPGAAELVEEGKFAEAALLALKHKQWMEACDLYLQAQQPTNAAQAALRAGNPRRAAEIYEAAGDAETAAHYYRGANRVEGTGPTQPASTPTGTLAGASARPLPARSHTRPPGVPIPNGFATTAAVPKPAPAAVPALGPVAAATLAVNRAASASAPIDAAKTSAPAAQGKKSYNSEAFRDTVLAIKPLADPRASGGSLAGSDTDITRLATELTRTAAEQLERRQASAELSLSGQRAAAALQRRAERRGATRASDSAGFVAPTVDTALLRDAAVMGARLSGPLDQLRRHLGGRDCDLQNIEVYYRLGLAQLARGTWDDALAALRAVDETSPGYRDAWKRIAAIEEWQRALANVPEVGVAGAADSDQPGRRHLLRGELGRGPLSVVYRAFAIDLRGDVVLRVFAQAADGRIPAAVRQYAQDATAAPLLARVHGAGELGGRATLSSEFLPGLTLEDLIDGAALTAVDALRLACDLLRGIAALPAPFIHGSLSPGLVVQGGDGRLRIADAGLALALRDRAGVTALSPCYAAPELIAGAPGDARSDVFSVGLILYELLAGAPPYPGGDHRRPALPLTDHLPSLPQAIDDAIRKAIDPKPERRWSSCAAFAAPLDRIVAAVGPGPT